MSTKSVKGTVVNVILGLIFIALIGIRTISTPEIWTHLAQGRTNAPISFLEADGPVNATHLYDKLVYTLYNIGDAPLLILFNVALILAAFILLLQVSKRWGGGLSQGFALLIAGHLLFRTLDVGPQSVMMLFIGLYLYLLTVLRKPAVLFGTFIVLQILWTNMHGSFLLGPLIVGLTAFQERRVIRRRQPQALEGRTLAILTLALLVATLFNPYFTKIYGQVMASINQPYPYYVGSLFTEYFNTPASHSLIFFALVLGAGGLITLKQSLPFGLTSLAILGAFLVVRSPFSAPIFAILAFPFLVLSFKAVGEWLGTALAKVIGKQANLLQPAMQGVLILLIILSIIPVVNNCAYTRLGSASSFGLGAEEQLFPEGPKALLEHPAFPKRALNLAADGGYLAFKYEREIFIDYRRGRYDLELLENLNSMLLGDSKAYDTLLDIYRPEAIILNALSPASAQGIVTLLARPAWKLAYFDGVTAILLLDKAPLQPLLNDTSIQAAGLARLEAARKAYQENVEKGCRASNSAELIGAGKIFLALNRPTQARAIFSLLLQGNDSIPGAWIGLGNSQRLLKEYDAASDSLAQAVELAPENLFAWISYARACDRAERIEERDRAMEKVTELSARMPEKTEEEAPVEPVAEEKKSIPLEEITIPE